MFRAIVKLTFYLFIFLLCTYVTAQVTIKGVVIDDKTGEPLIGATVINKADPTVGSMTDYEGAFEIKTKSSNQIELSIMYVGYENLDYIVTDAQSKQKIRMKENSVMIDVGVEIKGQRISDKQKAAPLTIESLDAIAIKQTASTDFYNGLGALKGVDLTTASLGFTVINTRGFNSTSPVRSLQTIDGVDNQSPGLNFSLGNFLGSSELDIQKVDLVVGASSAFYGPNAFNGVIAMETKNPFFSKGLSASIKVGERQLFETALRYADAFKNKKGQQFIAYKLNFSYLRAYDWVADNYDPVTGSESNFVFSAKDNPGGFNAVNIYGDEQFTRYTTFYDQRAGLNTIHRQGYKEIDVVDYNTRNAKANATIHIRTQPSKDFESPELVLASNFGYGTTVYQGDNRFSLRGIQFYQHKVEYRKRDKFFLRAYATHEDAGDSYDPYFTAQKMQEAASSYDNWRNGYEEWWTRNSLGGVFNRMRRGGYPLETYEDQLQWQNNNRDSLVSWHMQAANYANKANRTRNTLDYFEPGTARFDSLFNDITRRKNNEIENGTRFFDRSALFHIHGEYKFTTDFFKELVVGANGRLYTPFTDGTIFSDTAGIRIRNSEFGLYGGATKQFGNILLSAASRIDKNQNFNLLFSPAASMVWNPSQNNYLRLSFSSAIRNPTLSDQYLDLRVGPARLLGNINGFEDLVTLKSFRENSSDPGIPFQEINVPAIQPEKVRTFELGYRTTLFEKLYIDLSTYFNAYRDFIGYQIGLSIPKSQIVLFPGDPPTTVYDVPKAKVYRISANSAELVTSQGFAAGANYYFGKYYAFNGNYSYNNLLTNSEDDIIPAFNTPKHKYNVGVSGRDIPMNGKNTLGFNINYKWIQGFLFEGSPQFTGDIPDYDLLDVQVTYGLPSQNIFLKIGASNALNNKQFQTYGGPRIGRMAYITLTYDFKSKN